MGSVIAGGNFWRGAKQGAIVAVYNHAVHSIFSSEEGPTYEYKKDKNGNYVKVGEKGGDSFHYFYDAQGNIIAITDAKGNRIADAKEILKVSPVLTGIMDVAEFFVFGGLKGAQIAAIKAIRYLRGLSNAAKIAKGSIKAIKAGKYTITKTVAKNLSKRPYINSPSTITNIMKSGKGIPDATFKGGLNYKVPGTFRGSKGIYELGINPKTNTIYHFLFKTVK